MPLMVTRLADGGTRALREIAAPERRAPAIELTLTIAPP